MTITYRKSKCPQKLRKCPQKYRCPQKRGRVLKYLGTLIKIKIFRYYKCLINYLYIFYVIY